MLISLITELLRNISLLISLVFIQYLIHQRRGKYYFLKRVLQGVLVGIVTIILMNNSFEFVPGLILDTRTILLSIAGLYLGPVPAALGCVIAGFYRLSLGGPGMPTGILTILFSGGIGIAARMRLMKDASSWNWKKNILFGITVHAVVLVLFYFVLPRPFNSKVLKGTLLPYLILYPLITALLGKILLYQIDFRNYTAQLMKSNDLHRSLFYDNRSVMVLFDPATGKIHDANKAAEKFYGWSLDEFKTKNVYQIVISRKEEIQERIRGIEKNDINVFQASYCRADGSLREVEIHSNVIYDNDRPLIMAIVHDITDREKVVKQLKKSESLLSRAEIISNLGHWEFDLNRKEFYGSRGAVNIYGMGNKPLDMTTVQNVPLPEYRPLLDKEMSDLVSRGSKYDITFRIRRPDDGEIRIIHSQAEYDKSENTVFGIIHDITEYREAQDAITREKERLDVTLHSIGDGVITTDEKGCVQLINPIAEKMTGWTSADAIGRPLPEVFHIVDEDTRQACPNPVDLVSESGEIIELASHTILLSKDGRELIIADSGAPIKGKDGQIIGTVLVFRDTTEKQMLLNQMQKAEKLESLGFLAGGIAHDFNNLLTGIYGYLEMARSSNEDSTVRTYLDSAFKVYKRTVHLTRQLLTFSKGNQPDKKTEDLASLIRDSAGFSLSGSSVICQLEIQEDLYPCSFDRNQIGQVLDNLLINAKQAMPDGGRIILSAENTQISPDSKLSLPPGGYVCVSVKDFGHGIPKDVLPKIFDPFFTTKEPGTGLGLATCYSILEQHDGAIDVKSDKTGATFRFYLPAVKESTLNNTETKRKGFVSGGKILVMDDEEYVREILRFMLESMNFTVYEASDGENFLSILEDSKARGITFDAAILDLTIPGGMGGVETVKNIRAIGYNLPIFASSGYSEDPVMASPGSFGFTDSISKPFQKEDLSEMLSRHFKESD